MHTSKPTCISQMTGFWWQSWEKLVFRMIENLFVLTVLASLALALDDAGVAFMNDWDVRDSCGFRRPLGPRFSKVYRWKTTDI